jgi:hypothetical protein
MKWQGTIIMDLRRIDCEDLNPIVLAQDQAHLLALVFLLVAKSCA